MKWISLFLLLHILLSCFSLNAQNAIQEDGLDGEMKKDDPDWASFLDSGYINPDRSISSGSGFRNKISRTDCPPPLNQGADSTCGVIAFIHCLVIEKMIEKKLCGEPIDIQGLLSYYSLDKLLATIKKQQKSDPTYLSHVLYSGKTLGWFNEHSDVFFESTGAGKKLANLLSELAGGHPVMVRLNGVPVRPQNKEHIVERFNSHEGWCHAMVVIDYTPTHFIVMNSKGPGWGDGGFCKIPKDLFLKNLIDGIILHPKSSRASAMDPVAEPVLIAGGSTLINQYGYGKFPDYQWDSLAKTYIPASLSSPSDRFQLSIDIPENVCIYLLNFEPGKVSLLEEYICQGPGKQIYPGFSDDFPIPEAPEYLVLLFATFPIPNIQDLVVGLNKANGTVIERLGTVFGELLIDENKINRDSFKAGFSANAMSEGRNSVVPLVIALPYTD